MKKNHQTDLSKARQFAVDFETFKKLSEGEIKSAISFLQTLDNSPKVREAMMQAMYEDYIEFMSKKSFNGTEMEVQND